MSTPIGKALVGYEFLGNSFVQDPNPLWIKIDGVCLGESTVYGYKSGQNPDISTTLSNCYNDKGTVVVLYNWSNGKWYSKTGFNLNVKTDSAVNGIYTAYVITSRIAQTSLPNSLVWSPNGVSYVVGQEVVYNNVLYTCLNVNKSQSDWAPGVANSLWALSGTTTVTPVVSTPVVSTPVVSTPVVSTPVVSTSGNSLNYGYIPYLDMGFWPTTDMVSVSNACGVKYFTLAFIVAGSDNKPSIAGVYPLNGSSTFYLSQVQALRKIGGDVIMSFGGASGTYLANVSGMTLSNLVTCYQDVIDVFSLTYLDFDVEGSEIAVTSAVDLRNQALVQIKKNNPGIKISYTLPSGSTGLSDDGLYVLKSSVKYGLEFDVLNGMQMDMNVAGLDMGQASISGSQSLYKQLQSEGITSTTVGVTIMCGQQDTLGEQFTLANATTLLNWAKETPWVTRLSEWSIGRDAAAETVAEPYSTETESGIVQGSYSFSKILNSF